MPENSANENKQPPNQNIKNAELPEKSSQVLMLDNPSAANNQPLIKSQDVNGQLEGQDDLKNLNLNNLKTLGGLEKDETADGLTSTHDLLAIRRSTADSSQLMTMIQLDATDTSNDEQEIDSSQMILGELKQETAENSVKNLEFTEADLEKMHEELTALLEPLDAKGFIPRLAEGWGKTPLWGKLLLGGTLTVPSLAVGIAVNIPGLIIGGGLGLLMYGSSGAVLSYLNSCFSLIKNAKDVVLKLSSVLTTIIDNLAKIASALKIEVDNFEQQNIQYKAMLDVHRQQNSKLSQQLTELKATAATLNTQNDRLELLIRDLEAEKNDNKVELDKYKVELKDAKESLLQTEMTLNETTEQFKQANKGLEESIQKMEKEWEHKKKELLTIISTLTQSLAANEEEKTAFANKFKNFVEKQELTLEDFNKGVSQTQKDLASTQKELASTQKDLDKTKIDLEKTDKALNEAKDKLSDLGENFDAMLAANRVQIAAQAIEIQELKQVRVDFDRVREAFEEKNKQYDELLKMQSEHVDKLGALQQCQAKMLNIDLGEIEKELSKSSTSKKPAAEQTRPLVQTQSPRFFTPGNIGAQLSQNTSENAMRVTH